ncbi:MAG: extracellular solute-binding protein [Candidatus Nanopelagicales bacterium]
MTEGIIMGNSKRRALTTTAAAIAAVSLAACGGGSGGDSESTPGAAFESPNSNDITVLIGSSGEAETRSVKAAVAAWSKESGVAASVLPASDLVQQATQGFASGNPADILYVSTDAFAGWASNGSLAAYGDQLPNVDDFYPGLVSAFSQGGMFYCAPKDFSTLQLVINTKLWADAGLTASDVPKTWDDLEAVAKKLTKGRRVGLAFSPEIARLGVFLAQNGGGLVSEDGATATANSAENVAALAFVKKMMSDGVAAYSSALGSGWGGEAFGKQQAAMVIEGNWITGAMANDYKGLEFKIVELPAGTQQGTLQFTTCWGISSDGDNKGAALDLVKFLTTTDQQLKFAKDFGVMPSVQSAAEGYKTQFPEMEAFLNGAAYAQNLPAMQGAAEVLRDLNSQLEQLANKDPQAILDSAQGNFEAIVGG